MNNVTKVFQNMHEQQKINIIKSFGVMSENNEIIKGDTESTPEKKEIIKLLSSDNPFDVECGKELIKKSDMTDIEKSDIMEAISGYENRESFLIKKTGKDIKEQIKNVILPNRQAELEAKKSEIDKLLSECGCAPTTDPRPWYTNGIKMDIGYKIYEWEECRLDGCEKDNYVYNNVEWEECPKRNLPEDEKQCKARNDYNKAVEVLCNIMVDIKACEILTKNLSDTQSVSLTPRQVMVFKFD